jgi:hypothetical protein
VEHDRYVEVVERDLAVATAVYVEKQRDIAETLGRL